MAKTKIGSNATFTGAQLGLTTIGSHSYAFSGAVTNTTSYKNLLEWTSGKGYTVGTLTINGSVVVATVAGGNISVFLVSLNGVNVALVKTDSQAQDMPQTMTIPLLIPPLTRVTVESKSDDTNGAVTVHFVGRVYDA